MHHGQPPPATADDLIAGKVYRQSQSGVTIVGLGWFSPTDRKTFAVYRVFDTEGATFSRFSQRIRG